MTSAPRFSLRAAVNDSVSTGRREEAAAAAQAESHEPVKVAAALKADSAAPKSKRATTREGTRGVTVWVEPEVYRMLKLIGLDADMTTQDVMMEAINDLFMKKGKGRIAKTR